MIHEKVTPSQTADRLVTAMSLGVIGPWRLLEVE